MDRLIYYYSCVSLLAGPKVVRKDLVTSIGKEFNKEWKVETTALKNLAVMIDFSSWITAPRFMLSLLFGYSGLQGAKNGKQSYAAALNRHVASERFILFLGGALILGVALAIGFTSKS